MAGDEDKKKHRTAAARDQPGREGMRHIDRPNQVDLEHAWPVGRGEIPKRKTELSRPNPHREDHVIYGVETPGERSDTVEGRDVPTLSEWFMASIHVQSLEVFRRHTPPFEARADSRRDGNRSSERS